jgi:hypothetical protein
MFKNAIAFITIALLAAGCRRETIQTTFVRQGFPISVGSWWQYQVVDDPTGHTDTMTTTVVAAYGLNGGASYIWVNNYASGISPDTLTVTDRDTALSFDFYGYHTSYLSNLYIRFPITLGRNWAEPDVTISNITSLGDYATAGVTYPTVSLLTDMRFIPDNSKTDSLYISPDIGIVKRRRINQGWIYTSSTINLLAYHIAR